MFSRAARSRLYGGVVFSILASASLAFGADANYYTEPLERGGQQLFDETVTTLDQLTEQVEQMVTN